MDASEKVVFCKLVAAAIMADAALTDAEMDRLGKLMDQQGLDKAQRRLAVAVSADEDLEALARQLPADARAPLMAAIVDVIAVDGDVAPRERALLDKVGHAVGLSPEEISALLAKP